MDSNGSRSRRKISRVNYAEDFNNEEDLTIEEEVKVVNSSAKNGSTAPGSSSSSKVKRKSSKESSPSAPDNFPLNWQPKRPRGESTSQVMDFEDATVENGVMTLSNGETLAPEGE
jgi:hypothetical protein